MRTKRDMWSTMLYLYIDHQRRIIAYNQQNLEQKVWIKPKIKHNLYLNAKKMEWVTTIFNCDPHFLIANCTVCLVVQLLVGKLFTWIWKDTFQNESTAGVIVPPRTLSKCTAQTLNMCASTFSLISRVLWGNVWCTYMALNRLHMDVQINLPVCGTLWSSLRIYYCWETIWAWHVPLYSLFHLLSEVFGGVGIKGILGSTADLKKMDFEITAVVTAAARLQIMLYKYVALPSHAWPVPVNERGKTQLKSFEPGQIIYSVKKKIPQEMPFICVGVCAGGLVLSIHEARHLLHN